MTVMDYVVRLTELARYADDYVATNLAKVGRFENGLKLSIRGKILGLRLQDMDSMIETALTIEREMEDGRAIRAADTCAEREDQPSPSLRKRQFWLLLRKDFRNRAKVIRAKAKMGHLVRQDR